MASEPFRRVGRGGAGNFHPLDGVEDDEAARNKDPEAQTSSGPEVDAAIVADAIARKPVAEFAHTGRGGAGNYYSPKTMGEMKADVANSSCSPQLRRAGYQGRGGAGNFVGEDTTEEERLREVEAEKMDMITETIKRDVDMALKPPAKAHLAREGL